MLISSPRMYAAVIDVSPFFCLVIHCLLPQYTHHTQAATATLPEGRERGRGGVGRRGEGRREERRVEEEEEERKKKRKKRQAAHISNLQGGGGGGGVGGGSGSGGGA